MGTKSNPNHKKFFATFFTDSEGYSEVQVNGWWLIRHWDGNANFYTIDIYSPESYANHVRGKQAWQERSAQLSFINKIT